MSLKVKKDALKKRDRWMWYLYDVGNSAYAAVVILAIYSAYFKEQVVGGVEGSRLWGLSVGIAMLVVAVIAPVLGVIADFAGSKKRFLLFFTILSCASTASLFFVEEGDILLGMVLFILAEIGYRGGQVFYNSLLPEIADREDFGRVSGYGWAIGLIGGIVCLFLVMGLVMTHEGTWMVRFSLVITALYFAIFATPLFLWLQEKAKHKEMRKGENYLSIAVKRLRKTFASVRDHREFIKYIIAFLIYNDGILMMINFAAIFGVVMFGLAQQQIILFMILIQVTSVVGAFLSGWLTDFISAKKTLVIFLIMMLVTVVGLFFNNTVPGFYVIGGMAGLALSSVQAVSRAMVGKLGPPGRSAEFYGFFAVAGRTSSFIGPAVYGWVAAETAYWFEARGNTTSFLWFRFLEEGTTFAEQIGQRAAVIPVMLFLIVGLLILFTVDEKSEMARHHPA